jgi:hypothetical protein
MELEEAPMGIVGGLDIHRRQVTFDYLDERSGETRHGRIAPADRTLLRGWLQKLDADADADAGTPAAFAVEGCTGWSGLLGRAGVELAWVGGQRVPGLVGTYHRHLHQGDPLPEECERLAQAGGRGARDGVQLELVSGGGDALGRRRSRRARSAGGGLVPRCRGCGDW